MWVAGAGACLEVPRLCALVSCLPSNSVITCWPASDRSQLRTVATHPYLPFIKSDAAGEVVGHQLLPAVAIRRAKGDWHVLGRGTPVNHSPRRRQ